MKALRLTNWGKRAELCEVPKPQAGPGQVLIEVAGAGACHSDLHLMDWPEGTVPWKVPFTLGHENAGRIVELGAGVTGFKVGDPVLVYGPWGCGVCRECRLGRENYCENAATISGSGGGLGIDGGMAEYLLVPSPRLLIPLGSLDPVEAAPLADAALTPYHAIHSVRARLHAGATAVVIGIGGLGQMAVQLLKVTSGARIVAVDQDDKKLEIAKALGADIVARPTDKLPAADVVIDNVGSDATIALGAKTLKMRGRLVLVGLAGGSYNVNFFSLPYGASIETSYWGTSTELMELVALAQQKKIRIDVTRFPLSRALEAYDLLRRGEIRGRAVITPR